MPNTPNASPPRGLPSFSAVGIGASAGGLDACRKLLAELPADTGMAFILILHLDPNHESLMADLLTKSTTIPVLQAADGMTIEPDHLYVIPPGTYLAVADGALRLSPPQARHGARLPFDFLLLSLAREFGARAMCVVLSGMGADGSRGVRAIRDGGGLVVAQEPGDAGFDAMPRAAIATGAVDLTLPAGEIPAALVARDRGTTVDAPPVSGDHDRLPEIVALLRAKTPHDFTHYKDGTLRRRVERRMAMAGVGGDEERYLDILRKDEGELDLLAKDLLINVTGFFRDPATFEFLAKSIVPGLVRERSSDHPLRIWSAGCSTGEEVYSLAMLFQEEIASTRRDVKLQIFASDVDAEAVAAAREGVYPASIATDVSAKRLARFFTKEDKRFRVTPELRSSVVFTVQDVLVDPPFSRLDLISCRNLLIYLRPEAQAKAISLFHFALREGGILVLGGSETPGATETRFEMISRPERVYSRVGRGRAGEFGFSVGSNDATRSGQNQTPSRQATSADLCRRLVAEAYAPATVLINGKHECLYSLGPTDRYLRVPPGQPTHDLLSMVREGLSIKLRSAIQRALQERARVVVTGDRTPTEDAPSFSVDVRPVVSEGEELLLICFIDNPKRDPKPAAPVVPEDASRVSELEREVETTRSELQAAIHSLEISSEEQKAINEEALSVNEEFQSTNEELLTSKEELQSLNEELTALNGQLQETLERQRTTSNDLQNVLFSTDVATIFLDRDLNIRFFTPATKSLFSVIPGDVGRPLADLSSLATDGALLGDARTVLAAATPVEREIEAKNGAWYVRRVLPYRTEENVVDGVVITFVDITERRHVADALETAKRLAEQATVVKSRFLAAASHDLRQPMQTLTLLHGLLAKAVEGETAKKLVTRFDETLGAMSGMLNTLLNLNQIEAGVVQADVVDFPINDLFDRMRDEFAYHAQARDLSLRVVSSGASVQGDPRLLEQMIRNLLANALKYTKRGKILLGCRRRGGTLSVEVWDTGIGIADSEHQAIFEEYHQVDNPSRDRDLGLGLGLAIVRRLGNLLGHKVRVRSRLGRGSVFSIEIASPVTRAAPRSAPPGAAVDDGDDDRRVGTVLIVEDDPEVRELMELVLTDEGHHVMAAADGAAALDLVRRGAIRPDIILADFNLPDGKDGVRVATEVRDILKRSIPVVILTGDISTDTLRLIADRKDTRLHKPVDMNTLTRTIRRLLPSSITPTITPAAAPVIVVDDDDGVRGAIRALLEDEGFAVEDHATAEAFLEDFRPGRDVCLLIDAYLPGMSGLDLLRRLGDAGTRPPSIMITGKSDVSTAVEAMKAGALDFIEKPIGRTELLAAIERAFEQSRDSGKRIAAREEAARRVAGLTHRQRQIMDLVLAGHPSKNIAADLGVSQRTVENHRAAIMRKTGSKSLPALARLALAGRQKGEDEAVDK